jgi:hypothetical protein
VNNKIPIQSSPLRRRKELLNTIGVAILVLGFIAGSIIFWKGENRSLSEAQEEGTQAQVSSWKDGTIAPEDLKGSSRNIEMNFGKIPVLLVNWLHWWEELKPHQLLAIVVPTVTTLVASSCFLAAKRLPPDQV